MNQLEYHIGEFYQYPNDKRYFLLQKKVGDIFHFEGCHRVTDNVFMDMIRIKTGIPNHKVQQLEFIF